MILRRDNVTHKIMIIDLNKIDREQFDVTEHIVAGERAFLVQPQRMGVNWTPKNLIYRSSLWNERGEPMSLSWKKHHNFEEAPDIDPAPKDLSGCELMEKVDGSTLCLSRYNDTMIIRTRGTVDATKMANGDEIELFKTKYPKLFDPLNYDSRISPRNNRCHRTMVLEWVSPRNQIVIPYPEPDLYLTGVIEHADYSYASQDLLDKMASIIGVKRPRLYQFNTIPEMLTVVKDFKGVEGICVYYNNGQSWRKCKAAAYLLSHSFRENVTLPRLLDLFFAYGRPDTSAFMGRIEGEFDFECATRARDIVTQITHTYARVVSRYTVMEDTICFFREVPRREAAAAIMSTYQDAWRGAAFGILDKKPLDDKTARKLIEDALDKEVGSTSTDSRSVSSPSPKPIHPHLE
jgi:hypothetical protein